MYSHNITSILLLNKIIGIFQFFKNFQNIFQNLSLHKKIETRGGLSVRVFLHRFCIQLQIGNVALVYSSQKPPSGISVRVLSKLLTYTPFKFFGSTFLERKVEKYCLKTNFPSKDQRSASTFSLGLKPTA
jgi:hypothetical protein